MEFRNDIQGLRALAVLFVFIFHLSSTYLPGGFIGVDMFFVVSGFLISKIVYNKINSGSFSLLNFYEGRVKRIIPAYFFLLMCVWVLFQFIFTNSEVTKFRSWHFWTMIFNSNNFFSKSDDYFGASSSENPLLHSWTLSVEMQFYFILPLLLLLIRNTKMLLTTIFILTIVLLSYSTFQIYHGYKSDMYFSLLSRSPEFLIGMLLSIGNIEQLKIIKSNRTLIAALGTVGLLSSAILLNEDSFFPGAMALIPCVSIGMLLITPGSKINKIFSSRPAVYIGEISYSIYLWHWPVMAFLRYWNQRYSFNALEICIVIFATIATTLLSYYLIEKPLRNKKGVKFYLLFGILVTANVAMIFFIKPIKNSITPVPDEFGYPVFGIDSHAGDFRQVETFGDTSRKENKILLIGDSHGLTFKPYLHRLGINHGFSFRTITNDSYPTIPGIVDSLFTDKNKLNLYKKLAQVAANEIKNSDLIIIVFTKDGARWKNAIKKLVDELKAKQKILIVSDYPFLDRNPARYHTIVKNKDFVHSFGITYPAIDSELLSYIHSSDKIKYADLRNKFDFFDDAPFRKDTLIYYDASHLNEYGMKRYSEYSGSYFMEYLNWGIK